MNTLKPVLSGHSKLDKTKVLETDVSLKHVKSIAECSKAFCNMFDLQLAIIGHECQFLVFFERPFKTGFTVGSKKKKRTQMNTITYHKAINGNIHRNAKETKNTYRQGYNKGNSQVKKMVEAH